jgi:hypothetical protein
MANHSILVMKHVMENKTTMNFVSMLNNIEERLIALRLAFAHIFQLGGYGQYIIHRSVVNVPTNLNLVQNVLPRMPYDNLSIVMLLKRKFQKK